MTPAAAQRAALHKYGLPDAGAIEYRAFLDIKNDPFQLFHTPFPVIVIGIVNMQGNSILSGNSQDETRFSYFYIFYLMFFMDCLLYGSFAPR